MGFDYNKHMVSMIGKWASDMRILRAFTENRYLVIDLHETDPAFIGELMNLMAKYDGAVEYSAQGVV